MFNLRLSGREIGAGILSIFGELLRSLARGLGWMLAIVLCGGLIGAVAGAIFSISQDTLLLQSMAVGGVAGAALALLGIILVSFMNSW